MLRLIRKRSRSKTRLLLGALLGVWLSVAIAPCVAAVAACDALTSSCPAKMAGEAPAAAPCEQALDCAARDTNTPVSAAFEIQPLTGVVLTLGVEDIAPVIPIPVSVTDAPARPPHTPIYLAHLSLLT
jgi:hypothetical protein